MPINPGSFEDAQSRYGADREHKHSKLPRAKKAHRDLRELTFDRAIQLLIAQEAVEGQRPDDWRRRAKAYLRYRTEGTPVRIRVPNEIRQAVNAALEGACQETGFEPPKAQQEPTKKKRR
jgi:hypothetical protein